MELVAALLSVAATFFFLARMMRVVRETRDAVHTGRKIIRRVAAH